MDEGGLSIFLINKYIDLSPIYVLVKLEMSTFANKVHQQDNISRILWYSDWLHNTSSAGNSIFVTNHNTTSCGRSQIKSNQIKSKVFIAPKQKIKINIK